MYTNPAHSLDILLGPKTVKMENEKKKKKKRQPLATMQAVCASLHDL